MAEGLTEEQQRKLMDLVQSIRVTLDGFSDRVDTELREIFSAPAPAPAPAPVPAKAKPTGIDDTSLQLAFEDTFDGAVLAPHWRCGKPSDAAGGHHGYNWSDDPKNREAGYYLSRQVAVEGGHGVITAIKRPLDVSVDKSRQGTLLAGVARDTFFSPWERGVWDYQTGTLSTGPDRNGWLSAMASGLRVWTPQPPSFSMHYGVVEARIKLPKGKGLWPAFWMLPVDGSWSFEIDILEMVDPTGRHLAQHLHAGGAAYDYTANEGPGWDSGIDLTADFHTYAIDWSPKSVKWLVDGKVTQETSKRIPNVPMYLILNLAVGGKWPGFPDASTPFPARMEIDYVRAWSRAA